MPKGIKGFQKGNKLFCGKNNPNFGKHPSEETRKKLSESHKGYVMPEGQKKKISESLKGRTKSRKTREKISRNHAKIWLGKSNEARKGSKSNFWQDGKSFELYGFDWTNLLKHSIRTRDCFICQICKKHGWVVHHIDYNKKNNNPNNLITLCSNCHSKTNFNRKYWLKYFKDKLYDQ